MDMTWEQKLDALIALARIEVIPRSSGDWYVSQGTEISSDDSCVLAGKYGNGKTPIEAIENHWKEMVERLEKGQYIVTQANTEDRKHFVWNGFMWAELQVKNKAA